jgi:hypothetical protein
MPFYAPAERVGGMVDDAFLEPTLVGGSVKIPVSGSPSSNSARRCLLPRHGHEKAVFEPAKRNNLRCNNSGHIFV